MNFVKRYSLIIGLCLLILIVVVLLSEPGLVFSRGVTFIDTELSRTSGSEAYVRTRMDFGSQEHMSSFPSTIGDWEGWDYDTTQQRELLGADVILLRGYGYPGLYLPIFLTVMQARTESSFHPPEICYPSQGFKIQEEGTESVIVTDTSWAESQRSITIPLRKLVVYRESGQQIIDRRVVLFCYVKGNQFTSDTITMIRTEGQAPVDGSYDGILDVEKTFFAQTIPYMFEPAKASAWDPLALKLAGSGAGGYIAITFMLLVPLTIVIYPRTKWGRRLGEKNEPGK